MFARHDILNTIHWIAIACSKITIFFYMQRTGQPKSHLSQQKVINKIIIYDSWVVARLRLQLFFHMQHTTRPKECIFPNRKASMTNPYTASEDASSPTCIFSLYISEHLLASRLASLNLPQVMDCCSVASPDLSWCQHLNMFFCRLVLGCPSLMLPNGFGIHLASQAGHPLFFFVECDGCHLLQYLEVCCCLEQSVDCSQATHKGLMCYFYGSSISGYWSRRISRLLVLSVFMPVIFLSVSPDNKFTIFCQYLI
jgi:hypothetical protein